MARHLTLQEREMVSEMHHAHAQQVEIARRLGRHPSTISRELRRNRSRNGYWAASAQRKAERRRSERPWTCKMERPEIACSIARAVAAVLVARQDRRAFAERFSRRSAPSHFTAETRFTRGFTRNGPQEPTGAATCDAWGVCGDARKIGANCRPASRSKAARPWSIVGRAPATGKATRWLERGIAAEPSPWWIGNRDTS